MTGQYVSLRVAASTRSWRCGTTLRASGAGGVEQAGD
jgi:hypothetical protein